MCVQSDSSGSSEDSEEEESETESERSEEDVVPAVKTKVYTTLALQSYTYTCSVWVYSGTPLIWTPLGQKKVS